MQSHAWPSSATQLCNPIMFDKGLEWLKAHVTQRCENVAYALHIFLINSFSIWANNSSKTKSLLKITLVLAF